MIARGSASRARSPWLDLADPLARAPKYGALLERRRSCPHHVAPPRRRPGATARARPATPGLGRRTCEEALGIARGRQRASRPHPGLQPNRQRDPRRAGDRRAGVVAQPWAIPRTSASPSSSRQLAPDPDEPVEVHHVHGAPRSDARRAGGTVRGAGPSGSSRRRTRCRIVVDLPAGSESPGGRCARRGPGTTYHDRRTLSQTPSRRRRCSPPLRDEADRRPRRPPARGGPSSATGRSISAAPR